MSLAALSLWAHRVLFAEGFLNTFSALLMMFAPSFVLSQLGMNQGVDGAHLSITQQLGSIILILGYIGLRYDRSEPNILAMYLLTRSDHRFMKRPSDKGERGGPPTGRHCLPRCSHPVHQQIRPVDCGARWHLLCPVSPSFGSLSLSHLSIGLYLYSG